MTIRLLFYLFLILMLAACSHGNTTQPAAGKPHVTKQSRDGKTIKQSAATSQAVTHKHHIAISPSDPQKGINTYEAELTKHPHDQALNGDYIKGLEELRTSADHASEHGNVAQAGKIYNVLLKNLHDFPKQLSFNRDYLNTKLTYCKTMLSRKGFEAYRKGNLNNAIGYWRDYLAIDPNNPDIKKAVQTASAQRRNLEQKDRPPSSK